MWEVCITRYDVRDGAAPVVVEPGWEPFAAGLNGSELRVAVRRRVPWWARVLRRLRSRVPAASTDGAPPGDG